ncbi:MAG: transcriptional repressor, partial [Spirochaetota bacterium]
LGLEHHVTAEEVFAAARLLDPSIGQATVFRTIKLLADAGLAIEACKDDGARQFEHGFHHGHHDHLVCVDCGATVEFVDPAIEAAQDSIYRANGFESAGHRLELFGFCPGCATKRRGS